MSAKAQFFVALVTIGSLLFILRLVRRRQLRAKYSLLWLSLGVVLIVLAVSPQMLDRVSRAVGVAYPPTVFFVLAITLLLLIVIHFSWELSRLEERTRTLAEELALLRTKAEAGPSPGEDNGTHRQAGISSESAGQPLRPSSPAGE
ncbi:MAG: DUF2304 domain-containing protein [Actinomycetota bacterium]|nr:DUF2304 domain-containing protein [Actinomycetota bacterium]